MVIIAVEKTIFLHPVSEIISGIEIKDQLSRRRGETFDEEFDKQAAQIYVKVNISLFYT